MENKGLKEQARELLAKIPVEEKRELIAKSRWTSNSHWMMSMVINAGWNVANKTNRQVDCEVGKVEMHRLMKILGMEKPKNEKEFMVLMTLAMEMFITQDYFDYDFQLTDSNQWIGIIRDCYAWTKVRSIGVDKDYECGCFGLREGWYLGMGLEVKEKVVKCMKDGDDRCELMVDKIVFHQ